ncbi:hypothetical protein BAUCODRAFT_362974 [Baudoinia panamericana UAMH 10762]|uniref:Uncharacterized protein n=1 Tax=Baudoinia panamericana (strain UAMH 10762) TaxID=717646 RepID=M2N7H6_BAUPA|nr:uncharacterized protein BAUCODRAFT_362974 [Baudoinia panamericana UAMH 10762]EMD00034.1 hypothetical protein BAUCODRAFT_362974 [Baudoinia panamericana UAMH 10762]
MRPQKGAGLLLVNGRSRPEDRLLMRCGDESINLLTLPPLAKSSFGRLLRGEDCTMIWNVNRAILCCSRADVSQRTRLRGNRYRPGARTV